MSNLLAIDIGHGHNKVLHSPRQGMVTRTLFPSYVAPVSTRLDATSGVGAGLRTVTVEVEGDLFQVGKDVELAMPAGAERNRDDRYSRTPVYMALMLGALYYSRCTTVDCLVVGLPLSTLSTNAEALQRRLQGAHTLPDFNPKEAAFGKTTQVTIRQVHVVAQPLGALFAAIEQTPDLKAAHVLTLDYGFHTLDVLASAGIRPFKERMGTVPGGVASYIDHLQRAVGAEIHAQRPDLSGLFRVSASIYEEALQRTPSVVSLGPGDFELAAHSKAAVVRLNQDLQRAVALIKNASDINAIVLAGGGAALLQDPVRKHFPSIKNVVTLDDPQFAIARGFLAMAQLLTSSRTKGARHAV